MPSNFFMRNNNIPRILQTKSHINDFNHGSILFSIRVSKYLAHGMIDIHPCIYTIFLDCKNKKKKNYNLKTKRGSHKMGKVGNEKDEMPCLNLNMIHPLWLGGDL